MDILSLLGSGIGGSVVGAIGSIIKGRGELKARKQEIEHERETRKLDLIEIREESKLANARMQLENEGKLALAETESRRDIDLMAGEIRKAAYQNDKATYGGGWVDSLRGSMRSLLTVILVILTAFYAYKMHVMVGGFDAIPTDRAFTLYEKIINTILFMTTSALSYWFGSGTSAKK